MSRLQTKKIQAEVERLQNGPQKGWFTFIHHGRPVLEYSDNIMERVWYILEHKPEKEEYTRLRHIHFVPESAGQAHTVAIGAAWRIYDAAVEQAWRAYKAAIAPIQVPEAALKPTWRAHDEAAELAWRIYDAAVEVAGRAYAAAIKLGEQNILAWVPDCAWDGQTILTEEKT